VSVQLAESLPALSIRGLTANDVSARRARGETNETTTRSSRPIGEILRANLFTRFNALLGTLFIVMLIVGPPQDALFGLVLMANLVIGIGQELRAKWTLDRLAVVNSPRAAVIRSGIRQTIPVTELVTDDCIELQRGDQVPVDGLLLISDGLEVDESLLTGESQPIARTVDDRVLSGSVVAAGSGVFRATAVGSRSYARQLAQEARRFSLVRSELRDGINRILRVITWIIPPAAVLLIISQLQANDNVVDAVRGAVAGTVTLVPEGLVLLTSLAMAVAVVRLARRRALVQELPAVEGLARVDVLCLDKTGTLTEGKMRVDHVELLDGRLSEAEVVTALATLAGAAQESSPTLEAIRTLDHQPTWGLRKRVPFTSASRWSAVATVDHGMWCLGAPDVLAMRHPRHRTQAERAAAGGFRVLMLAHGSGELVGQTLPSTIEPAALVLLEERIRADAAQTLAYFADQGVAIKVISGDHPATLAAVASRAGLPPDATAIDGRDLPQSPADLASIVDANVLFGRITPRLKRDMVAALRSQGHVVAMLGDGVNDVLALKEADIGVAMASGSSATRAVAQVVLLASEFSPLPSVIAEGRRVIANIERLANLFITKTVYALLLAVAIGAMTFPFPFLPRHLTLVGSLSIGIPAFFLALAPNEKRARPGFVGRVLRFSIPAGIVAAAAAFGAYSLVLDSPYASFAEAQTMATIVLVGTSLWLLTVLARPFTIWRTALVGGMVAAFLVILATPITRSFFALDVPSILVTFAAIGIVAVAGVCIELGWWLSRGDRPVRLYDYQP